MNPRQKMVDALKIMYIQKLKFLIHGVIHLIDIDHGLTEYIFKYFITKY